MKKVQIFLTAALVLSSVFAFTNAKRFLTQPIYVVATGVTPTTSNTTQITASANLIGFTETPSGSQSTIKNNAGSTFDVYDFDGTNFNKLYSTGW